MDGNITKISYYDGGVAQVKNSEPIALDQFLEDIKEKWQDVAIQIRCIPEKKARDALKVKIAPCVTPAGTFLERTDAGLERHSEFIAIDVDEVPNINETKEALSKNEYVYSVFVSIGGRGLCVLFKINPTKHREAFMGISAYLNETYGLACDPTSINVSRTRFVSWDPDIYINHGYVRKFADYPKEKPPQKIPKVVFVQNDFEQLLKQIYDRQLNIAENYYEWLRIGFGLADKFGEQGREYFHTVSRFSNKYDSFKCDRQYNACLKGRAVNKATIGTFYYYCKQAGLETTSKRTKDIVYAASFARNKAAGTTQEKSEVQEHLKKFYEIEGPDVDDIIDQVVKNNIEPDPTEDCLMYQVEIWLRQYYDLRRNVITRFVEDVSRGNKPLTQIDLNSIYGKVNMQFEKLTYEKFERKINSDFIREYNPFEEYFQENQNLTTTGHIEQLFSCIQTKNERDSELAAYFGCKWLVGIISSLHEKHSPLMLVLCGEKQNTGKTEFFRNLLPEALRSKYYGESKLIHGKDDEILMTQKALIMDDEMAEKDKRGDARMKELLSKQVFSLREPYGKNNIDLIRIAVLAGTTNEVSILTDYTGNRRILPVYVESIDVPAYKAVDKDALFMEAYHLWKSGFPWQLTKKDIALLKTKEPEHRVTTNEGELAEIYFEKCEPDDPDPDVWKTVEALAFLNQFVPKQILRKKELGQELKYAGFTYDVKTVRGISFRGWWMKAKTGYSDNYQITTNYRKLKSAL